MNAALNGLPVVHSLPAVDAAGAADAGATDAATADAGATDGASDAAGVAAELHAANSAVTNPSTTANRTLRLVLLTAMSPCLPIDSPPCDHQARWATAGPRDRSRLPRSAGPVPGCVRGSR